MNKRILLAALIATAVSGPVLADEAPRFEIPRLDLPRVELPRLETAPTVGLDLCRHGAVREAIRLEHDLKPVKEMYDIATNPTGFVIKTVSKEAGIKIPRFVGYAMDPQGSLRASVMKRVRDEVKKQGGLQDDCAVPAIEVDDESDGPFPQPENDAADAA